MKSKSLVYLDVEIRRSAPEAGGWNKLHKVGISVAVGLSSSRLHIFTAKNIRDLVPILEAADAVVGYNIRDFDFKVLSGHRGVNLENVKSVDLMWEIANVVGHRLPLASLRAATLGYAPETDGLELIKLWKKGEVEQVIEACCNDVLAMRQLHEYGIQHGELFYFKGDSKRRTKIEVEWTR